MFLFFVFAVSKFIPYRLSEQLQMSHATKANIQSMIENNSVTVVFVADPKDSPLINTFASTQALYPEVLMSYTFPDEIKDYLNMTLPKDPYMVVTNNGKIEVVIGPMFDDSTVMMTADLWITKKRKVLTSEIEFIGAMNGGPRTLAVTEDQFEKGLEIAKSTGVTDGPLNVVKITRRLAKLIGAKKNGCALYRRDDQAIEVVPKCSIENYRSLVRPYFSTANQYSTETNQEMVVIHYSLRDDSVGDVLAELGKANKNLQLVIADSELEKKVEEVIHDENWTKSFDFNFVVVNFTGMYYYNLTSDVKDMLKRPWDADDYLTCMLRYFRQILHHEIPKVYFSEDEDNRTKSSMMQKAVGNNFHRYVDDPDRDTLIIFLKPGSKHCFRVFSYLREFGTRLDSENNSDYWFLMYNVSSNMLPEGNPVDENGCPTVLFYPANDRENPKILPVETLDVMKWLVARYSTKPINVTYDLPQESDIDRALKRETLNYLSPSLKAALEQQVADLREDIRKAKENEESKPEESEENKSNEESKPEESEENKSNEESKSEVPTETNSGEKTDTDQNQASSEL